MAMGASPNFILKVFGLSIAIALLIKQIAPLLNVPPTAGISLLLVLSPTVVMAGVLAWQLKSAR